MSPPGFFRLAPLFAFALAVGCGSSSSSNGIGPGVDAGPSVSCPDGFTADDQGLGCIDVSPSDDCPAGTRATIGSTDCKPVAAIECKDGFVADSSGWGCRDVQPAAACSGAMREALGQTSCAPVGDCGATFPPSAATIFVGPTVTPDATHFTTIQAAIDAAPSGATVAVDSGTYTEALTVKNGVTIAGRCAAMVTLESPAGTAPGIATSGAPTWSASGLTVKGGDIGVNVAGGNATLDAIVVEGATGVGVRAKGGTTTLRNSRIHGISNDAGGTGFGVDAPSGTIAITDSAIVFAATAGINTTSTGKVTLTHSIVRDTDGGGGTDGQGVGAACSGGGHLDVEASAFTGNHVAGIVVLDKGSVVTANGSVFRGSLAAAKNYGEGILVMAGGEADVTTSTLSENAEWGLTADGPNAKVTMTTSVVRGGNAFARGGIAVETGTTFAASDVAVVDVNVAGIVVQDANTSGTLENVLVRDVVATTAGAANDGMGIFVGVGATATLNDVTTARAAADGVWVGGDAKHQNGSHATITRLLAIDTKAAKDGRFGRGIEVGAGAVVTVDASAFARNVESAFVVDAYASATITGSVLSGSGLGGVTGFGLLVVDNASASLSGSWVRDTAGVGLAFGGAAAGAIDTTAIIDNQVGIYADATTSLSESDDVPDPLPDATVDVVSSTSFVGNATRVSADAIPLPGANTGL